MKQLAVIVMLVACHRSEPAAVEKPPPAAAPLPVLDQATAMARWRALAPTGSSMYDVVDKLPVAQRPAMLFALVRDGHMKCTRMATECGQEFIAGPEDGDGLDAPCLRRRLVEYMLRNAGRIAVPADVRTAIAGLADAELVDALADSLDDRTVVDFLVEAEAAGTRSPYGVLIGRPHAVVVDAARRHVDDAVDNLDASSDRELLIAAIADTQIAAETRASALILFDMPSSPALIAALEAAAREPHCELSARAAETLAEIAGDKRWLPRPPAKHDPKAYFHEVCRLTDGDFFGDDGALGAPFAPKAGIVLVAPRGEPYADDTKPSRRMVTADGDLVSFLRGLANSRCDTKTCVDETARYELTWSANVLARVTVHRDLAKEKIERDKAAAAECTVEGAD